MHVVCFDIDGTLVASAAFDADLHAEAIRDVLGVEIDTDWSQLERVDDDHWDWLETDEQGMTRSRLSLSFHSGGRCPERVQLFSRTQRLADEGRAWFESLACDSVAYQTREITDHIRRYYAHWADEPIPALNDRTPREAMATAAGAERVKGLLRSYEALRTAH